MKDISIEMLSLDALKPYDKNPRKNDDAVQYVANSIKEFGFKVPIVIDANNTIIAGHTRYKAAKEIGMSEVPCIRADDLTDEQVKAFRLADNKTGELADWDEELLKYELDDIADWDMSEFGFLDDNEDDEILRDDISDDVNLEDYKLIVSGSENQLSELYDRLTEEGYQCKLST